MQNIFKPSGSLKASTPSSGGANPRLAPVFGVVKNNIDPNRTGRLQVYIAAFGSPDPDDYNNWCTVSYLPPFYGFVKPNAPNTGFGDYISNPSSYGIWNSPPDIGTTVICIFINGDPNYGFYIGCVPEPDALHMVPAIGASDYVVANTQGEGNGYGGATRLPVTNINTNNTGIADSANFLTQPKPIHSYVAMIMNQQGLIRDTLRGPISTSAQRESPSRVGWGVSTPGRPIYEGGYTDETIALGAQEGLDSKLKVIARRGGHSIVMDDGDIIGRDQLIRIRSAAGHQITLSDDGQTIFITHSNGQSYIELGKEGTIDCYSTNSFNVRTQGDVNFHSDNNININAKKKLNIYADEINVTSEKSTNQIVGENYSIYTKGNYTYKIDGSMSMFAKGESSYASSGTMFINGSVINLNTGETSVVPKIVQPIAFVAHTDTLFDNVKGYAAAPGKLVSIVSRAPAHMPWANAGQGVNVETSTNASDVLPSSASSSVQSVNNESASANVSSEFISDIIASVPPIPPLSENVNASTTAGILSAISKNAATGPASFAVKNNSGIVPTINGNVASIGKLALTPDQLEQAGIIKPGSSKMVNSLINQGYSLQKAMPDSIFTGKNGATSLQAFTSSKTLQIQTTVETLKKSETELINTGVITGKESGESIAGLIVATNAAGVNNVVNTLKTNTSVEAPSVTKSKKGILGSIKNAISSGNKAAKIANNLGSSGAIGDAATNSVGVTGAVTDTTKSASAAAFNSITSSFKPLQVGVPQNLTQISNQNSAKSISNSTLDDKTTAVVLSTVGQVTGIPIKQITNYVNQISNSKDPSKTLSATSGLLSTLGRVTGDKSLNDVGRIASSSAGVFNAINTVNSAKNPTQTINGISTILNSFANVSNSIGNPAAAKSLREIGSLAQATAGAANSITKLNASANPAQAISSVSGVVRSIGKIGSVLGEPSLVKTTNNVNSILNSTGQILRSTQTITTTNNPNAITASVGNIINNINRISSVLSNTGKSTGLSALPGALYSVGSIVNQTTNRTGLPGTSKVQSTINNVYTANKNNVSVASASQEKTNQETQTILAPENDIKKVVLSELPAGEAAQLKSAIASVSKNSSTPINLPVNAVNTNDRSEINTQIKSLLGNSKIPLPNFSGSGPSDSAKNAVQKTIDNNIALTSSFNSLIEQNEQVEKAKIEYFEAESSLPAGDPKIEETKNKWLTLKQELDNKFKTLLIV